MIDDKPRSTRVRLIEALLLQTELVEKVRGVGVLHQWDGTMTVDPEAILPCCASLGIECQNLSLQDVAHFTSTEHIAESFNVDSAMLLELVDRLYRLVFIDFVVDKCRGH